MKQIDKQALNDWEKYKEEIARSTPVDKSMTHAEREKHRLWLEAHPIEWIKFFYPGYAKYEFAPFQKRAIKRILANDEWFEVLSWSRELAKSTITMFIVSYLVLTGRKKNIIILGNGKNIYPEELEDYIGGIPYVLENVVYAYRDESGAEDALAVQCTVEPELLEKEGKEALEARLKRDVFAALEKLPTYKQVTKVIIREVPFVVTSSKKIRRAKDGSPM